MIRQSFVVANKLATEEHTKIRDVLDQAYAKVVLYGFCKIELFGETVGVCWLGPRGEMRSWFEPIGREL